ncbi:MAG: hypothetical protein U1D55_04220 [Phycisphaerae bacterium]
MKSALASFVTLAFATFALAQPNEPGKTPERGGEANAAHRALAQRVTEITFTDAPLEQVIDWLRELAQINVMPRWEVLANVGIKRDTPVSLSAKNMRLSQILWLVMHEASAGEVRLAYRAGGNLLILSTAEDLDRETFVRVYDVMDLLVRVPRFRGPIIDPAQSSQGGAGSGTSGGTTGILQTGGQQSGEDTGGRDLNAADPDEPAAKLIEVITSTIEPDSWELGGGRGTIRAYRGMLIVRNSAFVHQQIGGGVTEPD